MAMILSLVYKISFVEVIVAYHFGALSHERNLFCLPGQERFSCCIIKVNMV